MLFTYQVWKRFIFLISIMLSASKTRAFGLLSRHSPRAFRASSSRTRLFASTASAVQNDFLKEKKDVVLTYLTDVEGDKAYLDRYVQLSKVLEFSSIMPDDDKDFPYDEFIKFSQDNSMLVFGGDLWDKGGFDLYVARQLLYLKKRHPDRVFFVWGNRDVNKLRILQELGFSNEDMPKHPGIMWLHGTGRIGDPDGPLPSDDPVERLQWILGNTMGSPDAFSLRKSELEWEREQLNPSSEKVTDMNVVESYRQSCHPDGEMGQFLANSHLALRIGPVLVVHGSLPLTDEAMSEHLSESTSTSIWDDLSFCMPWIKPGESAASDYGVTTIEEWLDALNKFSHDKVQEWKQEIKRLQRDTRHELSDKNNIWAYQGGYDFGPSYGQLIQYGMGLTPSRKKNPTVVYNSFTPEGMPHSFDPDADKTEIAHCTREFFDRSRIQLLLAGHKPQGDMPSPIRVDSSSWVLCCDTSYSGETIWINQESDKEKDERTNIGRGNALSFRGEHCVSEVLVNITMSSSEEDCAEIRSVKYHGVLSDGMEYETANLLAHADNSTIGQVAPNHLVPSEINSPHQGRWWTKSVFSDGSFLFHAGEGFNVWNYFSKQSSSSAATASKEVKK